MCEGDNSLKPSKLAHLLSATYREMLDKGSMSINMRTGVISLLYKDKGR